MSDTPNETGQETGGEMGEETGATSPQQLRCYILSQMSDTSEPVEQLIAKMRAIEAWITTGRLPGERGKLELVR